MFLLWLRQLPHCGDRTPASVPHTLRAGLALLTLLFFPLVPSSYWVLSGSIYSFPLVRYACPLPAGVLHALLCLKAYSWCIWGERSTPHLPTPPSSCSLLFCYTLFSKYFFLECVCVYVCVRGYSTSINCFILTRSSLINNMPANLENSVVATGLEKVSFLSNPKERQCQRMVSCTRLTR